MLDASSAKVDDTQEDRSGPAAKQVVHCCEVFVLGMSMLTLVITKEIHARCDATKNVTILKRSMLVSVLPRRVRRKTRTNDAAKELWRK